MAFGATNSGRHRRKSGRGGLSCAAFCLLLGGLFVVLPTFAHAQIEDPFAVQGLWLNVESYDSAAPSKTETPLPDVKPAEEKSPQHDPVSSEAKGKSLTPAPPERPLNYPSMPSSKTAAPVAVSSTAEEESPALEDKKEWKGLEEAQQEEQKQAEADRLTENKDEKAFSIRYATLPGRSVKSSPADRVTKSLVDRDTKSYLQKKKSVVPEKKKDEVKNACEALTEYRKRQLDEIESDRHTLAQLKSALSTLGLTDRLSFMTSSQGLLTQPTSTAPEAPPAP